MSKKQEFLRDLENLCKKYDCDDGSRELEIHLDYDGDETVINVAMPFSSPEGYYWENFILESRPYWEEVA